MSGVLISETTREERERLVAESLGNVDVACDGCAAGVIEMYQDYIDGRKELREVNMEYCTSQQKLDTQTRKLDTKAECQKTPSLTEP